VARHSQWDGAWKGTLGVGDVCRGLTALEEGYGGVSRLTITPQGIVVVYQVELAYAGPEGMEVRYWARSSISYHSSRNPWAICLGLVYDVYTQAGREDGSTRTGPLPGPVETWPRY